MFFELQRTARALPTDGRHPRRGRHRGCRAARARRGSVPPGEMWTRAPGVDDRGCAEMLPEVEQHVDHAGSHLPRRRQRTNVVPISDDLPPAAEDAIDGERQADGEPVHAAAGTARLIPLDDEVSVILLDGEVNHPESIERGLPDGTSERPEHPGRSERREPGRCSDRDLQRVSGVDLRPRVVGHRRSASRFSSRPLSCTTPPARRLERQPQLPSSSRLDSAHVPLSARTASGCAARADLNQRVFRLGAVYRRPPLELPRRPRWPRYSLAAPRPPRHAPTLSRKM